MTTSPFSAQTVVTAFRSVERDLSDVLDIVPFCAEHESVWSPSLITILLEAGSQLDSLWRASARLSKYADPDPDIVDFFTYHCRAVGPRWIAFWGEEPVKLMPFAEWAAATGTARADYKKLPWWNAYTSLKHDRIVNRTQATLKHAICAVAGLFIAILKCEPCRDAVAQTQWLTCLAQEREDPAAWLGEDTPSAHSLFIAAETHLFTYAVGWSDRPIVKGDMWVNQTASQRFRRWFNRSE
ncbi:MAG: hypothetical protein WD845_01880 [Pirellulales bacterium]